MAITPNSLQRAYQIIESNGTPETERNKLNFSSSFTVTDNPSNGSTDVDIAASDAFVSGTLTNGRLPVANGTHSLTDSNFTASSNTLDLASSGLMIIGDTNAGQVRIGNNPSGGIFLDGGADAIHLQTSSADRWLISSAGGHFIPSTDLGYSVGQASYRVNNGYFGGTLFTPQLDTQSSGTLYMGPTNATGIQLGHNSLGSITLAGITNTVYGTGTVNTGIPLALDTTATWTGGSTLFDIRNNGVSKAWIDCNGYLFATGIDSSTASGTIDIGIANAASVTFSSGITGVEFSGNTTLYPGTAGSGGLGSPSNYWGVMYAGNYVGNSLDTLSATTLSIGTGTSNAIDIGNSSSPLLIRSTTNVQYGTTYTQFFADGGLYVDSTAVPSSGTPTVNSPNLFIRGKYWDGSAGIDIDNSIATVVDGYSPATSYLDFNVQGKHFTMDSVGAFGAPGDILSGSTNAIYCGTYGFDIGSSGVLAIGTHNATLVNLGYGGGSGTVAVSMNGQYFDIPDPSSYIYNYGALYQSGQPATSGSTLKDSSVIYFRPHYWTGSADSTYDISIQAIMDDASPSAHLQLAFPGADRLSYGFYETSLSLFSPKYATSGSQLQNSPSLTLVGSYWNGSAALAAGVELVNVMDTTVPTNHLSVQFNTVEKFQMTNTGTLYIGGKIDNIAAGLLNIGGTNATEIKAISNAADSSSAICFQTDTNTTWTTAGSKLASFRTNGSEKAFISSSGEFSAQHLIGAGSTPTVVTGSAAQLGTGPSVTITGASDTTGVISLQTGTSTVPFSAGSKITICTISFNTTFGSAPRGIVISPANDAAAELVGSIVIYASTADSSTTQWVLSAISTSSPSLGTTVYQWSYVIVQ